MAKARYQTHGQPYLDRIKVWVAKGASDREVARKLHVATSTLNTWKKRYPEFADVIKAPQGEVDDEVEASLYKRCTGYDYEEVTRWQTIGKGGELIWLEKRTTKHLPPDPSSIQFWLTNRRPAEWKRMPEVKEAETDDETGVVILPEVKDE